MTKLVELKKIPGAQDMMRLEPPTIAAILVVILDVSRWLVVVINIVWTL